MTDSKSNIDKKLLERGYWIATHRLVIQKWLTIGLYIIVAALYSFFFVHFGIYLFLYSTWQSHISQATRPVYNWEAMHQAEAPKNISFGPVQIFSLGDDRYDLIVEAYNPNDQWGVEFLEFQFIIPQIDVEINKRDFILPQERRFLSVLGYQSSEPIVAADFNVLESNWRKINSLPPLKWIYTSEPKFTSRRVIINQGTQSLIPASVKWSVKNGSTLNLSQVTWQVALYTGNRLVYLVEYKRDNFPFLQEEDFDITIPGSVPSISQVEVFPIVDIFDPNYTYLAAKSGDK